MIKKERDMEIGIARLVADIDSRLESPEEGERQSGLIHLDPGSRPETLLEVIHQIADENVPYLGIVGGSLLERVNGHYKIIKQFGVTPLMRTNSTIRSTSLPLDTLQEQKFVYRYDGSNSPSYLKNKTLIGLGPDLDHIIMLRQKRGVRHHDIAEAVLRHLSKLVTIVMEKGDKYQGIKGVMEAQDLILDAAHEIQRGILPKEQPKYEGYDIFGHSVPAETVGGDYYNFFPIGDNLIIPFADAIGHGLPASLYCRTVHTILGLIKDQRPETIIKTLNQVLIEEETTDTFVTLFYCELSKLGITYTNAGHNPPYLFHNGRFTKLKEGTPPLGISEDLEVPVAYSNMVVGDALVLYSDGIIEQVNERGRQFGLVNLRKSIRKYSEGSAEDMVNGIFVDLEKYCNGSKQLDDRTVLVAKKL